ncbi:sensor histidine kinase, partial [Rhizobium sp. XQZ8]|uniref:sensor histidine kinase n=1 Tax=Rhizobium populisoli TaxID=2859785 RepID=UPI001CA4B5F4
APSKSDRNESAEPIANLLFAPSIQIRPALGTPRVSISDNWYKHTETLQAALAARTLLVHEVDHRVKNNLLTMASIVKLQARITKDDVQKRTLMSVLNRVEALSTVQRKLFTLDDVSRFDIADFTREMVTDLVGAVGRDDIRLTLDLHPVYVPAVKATPLSLIVNELVGDAVRRGLSDGGGDIHVVVKRLNGHFLIRVEDTSIPVEVDKESAEVGRILLETSARQVEAKIEKQVDGHRTTVDVTLLVDAAQENAH